MATPDRAGAHPQSQDGWEDLDTDEIRSTASDELHATRPNRFRGAPSTWRSWTEEERLLHQSMEQQRNQNLSIHLYNTFALNHRDIICDPKRVSEDGGALDIGDWRPPQTWAAWPMSADRVPSEQLLKETHDEHDDSTIRKRDGPRDGMPGRALEEEIVASILRDAKERFEGREWDSSDDEGNGKTQTAPRGHDEREHHDRGSDDEPDSDANSVRSNRHATPKDEPRSEVADEGMDLDEPDPDPKHTHPEPSPTRSEKQYIPVVSADDDLSHSLLRPSVRHILTRLDATLATIHNIRMAGLNALGQADDSASDRSSALSDVESEASHHLSPRKRRAQSKTQRSKSKSKSSETKNPAPTTSDDEHADHESASDEPQQQPSLRGRKQKKGKGPAKRGRSLSSTSSRDTMFQREGRIRRWGLLGWRDVLGAAAVSGFDRDVVARAAQRCADLFGQSMEFRTLEEGKPHYDTVACRPGLALPAFSDDESGDAKLAHLEEMRRRLRIRSAARRRVRLRHGQAARRASGGGGGGFTSEGEEMVTADEEPDPDYVPPDGRSLGLLFESRPGNDDGEAVGGSADAESAGASATIASVTAAADGLFYCPVTLCKRHKKGFNAKRGVQEHFRLMHDQPTAEIGTYYCPVTECKYHMLSFKTRKNLNAHLRKKHTEEERVAAVAAAASTPRAQGSSSSTLGQGRGQGQGLEQEARLFSIPGLVGSDDEMDGGVHVDGFLRPIKIRKGWLTRGGRELGQVNKPKKEDEDEEDDE